MLASFEEQYDRIGSRIPVACSRVLGQHSLAEAEPLFTRVNTFPVVIQDDTCGTGISMLSSIILKTLFQQYHR